MYVLVEIMKEPNKEKNWLWSWATGRLSLTLTQEFPVESYGQQLDESKLTNELVGIEGRDHSHTQLFQEVSCEGKQGNGGKLKRDKGNAISFKY